MQTTITKEADKVSQLINGLRDQYGLPHVECESNLYFDDPKEEVAHILAISFDQLLWDYRELKSTKKDYAIITYN